MSGSRTALPLVPLLMTVVVACSGSDETGSDGASGLPEDARAVVACLGDAGIAAEDSRSTPFGVDDPVVGVKAGELPVTAAATVGDDGQGVTLWIFDSPEAASSNRALITLKDEDDAGQWVTGRVVVDYFYAAVPTAPEVVAVDACVKKVG